MPPRFGTWSHKQAGEKHLMQDNYTFLYAALVRWCPYSSLQLHQALEY